MAENAKPEAGRDLVVGIGASAGGLESFQEFFDHMPPDSGMSFILIQHLDPNHESLMVELLAKRTAMPVVQAEEGLAVEANHVYLIAPDSVLTLQDRTLHVQSPRPADPLRAPIDTFFQSLAEDQGEVAVGIVLSGTGTDGSRGLRHIKDHGGLTLAQAEASAKYSGMPRSAVATGAVDHVLEIEAMPGRLLAHAEHASRVEPDEIQEQAEEQLDRIFGLLQRQLGHDFSLYKKNTVLRRIQRRMQVLRIDSVQDYVEALEKQPVEVDLLFQDLLIGVTRFFREPESFEVLGQRVLPRLFEGKKPGDTVRVWVPGCATGEEAYSLAMLLKEEAETAKTTSKIQIFATDIDEEALAVARSGRYPGSIAADVPEERLSRFFAHEDDLYRVDKGLRELCIFSPHDLIQDPPFSRLDLISCRNLLIYLDSELQKRILPVFHYALRPDGFLFLGPSEGITARPDLFQALDKKQRIFRRRDVPSRMPFRMPIDMGPVQRSFGHREPPARSPLSLSRTAERIVLKEYSPAAVVIDSQGYVLHFQGRTGRFLEPPDGAPDLNLLVMARRGLRTELRNVIHRARKQAAPAASNEFPLTVEGTTRRVRLTARPISASETPGDEEAADLLMVLFEDRGLEVQPEAKTDDAEAQAEDAKVRQLEEDLRRTEEHLQTTVEELESSNEELRSSNEELMSMNEELQSSNEELETSREELQSVNEELETVNAELHHKIEELSRANSDLKNLLESTRIATIFLDDDLRIQRFTPAAQEIFHLRDGDVGRPLTDITRTIDYEQLETDVEAVLDELDPCERQVRDREGRWFMMRILPYRTVENVVDGVVMTFVDVTDLRKARDEIARLNHEFDQRVAELETILELIPVGVAISEDSECQTIRLNRRGSELHMLSPGLNVSKSHAEGQEAPYRALIDGEEVSPEELPMQRACGTGEVVEEQQIELLRQDGSSVFILMSASPLFDDDGSVRGAVGAFLDVTQHRLDRREAETRARQQAAVSKLGLSALRTDSVDEVLAEAVRTVRDTLDVELIKVLEWLPDDGEFLLRAGVGWEPGLVGKVRVSGGKSSQGGYSLTVEEPVIVEDLAKETRFDGPELLIRHGVVSGVSVLIMGRGGPWGVFGAHTREHRIFSRDDVHFVQAVANVVTAALERRRMEAKLRRRESELAMKVTQERLRRAERLASVGTLAAGIAHEVNNPVSSILMTAENALAVPERLQEPETIREDFRVIAEEAERCGDIVRNVLGFAREDVADKELQDLDELVQRAVDLVAKFAQQAGARLELDLHGDLPSLWLSSTEIEQVVVHLLRNAVEAGDEGLLVQVATDATDGVVRLIVQDDGPGISVDHQRHVFDPFFTTRREEGSTGLGLSLVHAIVHEHGGTIQIDSHPNQGSRFEIEWPVPDGGEERDHG